MNDHDEPLDPLAPPDAEETHAANALREALEARAGGAEAPSSALATAALLRSIGPAGRLSDERRASLRNDLLAGLEAARERGGGGTPVTARAGLRRWLTLLLPLTGGAAALIVFALFQWQGSDEAVSSGAATEPASLPTQSHGNTLAAAPSPTEVGSPNMALQEAEGKAVLPFEAEPNADSLAQRATGGALRSAPSARAAAPSPHARAARKEARAEQELSVAAAEPAPAAAAPAMRGIGSLASSAGASMASAANAEAVAPAAQPAKPSAASSTAGASAAARPGGAPPAPAELDARLARQAQTRRAALLPRLRDERLNAAYAALDRAHSSPELRAAQSQLLTLTSGALGGEGVAEADGTLARQDIFCRLAETALRLGQPDAALAWARRGLQIDAVPNVFGARLHALAGQAQAALGDRDGAARSYGEAIEIDEKLLDESLDGTP